MQVIKSHGKSEVDLAGLWLIDIGKVRDVILRHPRSWVVNDILFDFVTILNSILLKKGIEDLSFKRFLDNEIWIFENGSELYQTNKQHRVKNRETVLEKIKVKDLLKSGALEVLGCS